MEPIIIQYKDLHGRVTATVTIDQPDPKLLLDYVYNSMPRGGNRRVESWEILGVREDR